jgi:hypothetical protein
MCVKVQVAGLSQPLSDWKWLHMLAGLGCSREKTC